MIKRASAVFAAAMLALTGCSGEDGDPGARGTDGTSCTVASNGDGTATVTCTDGTVATVADGVDGVDAQTCLLSPNPDGTRTLSCPDGSSVVLPAVTLAGKVEVSDQVATTDGADVVVTFKVKLNGAASNAFTNKASGYSYAGADSATAIRSDLVATAYTLTAGANGSYTARIPGKATTTPTTFMLRVNTGTTATSATVVAHLNGKPKSTVGDQACMNCHGNNVFHAGSHKTSRGDPQGVGACVVCHVVVSSSESRLGTSGATGTAPGTRLMGYVHGIHNSHNMPAGNVTVASIDPDGNGPLPAVTGPFTVAKPEGVYARNGSLNFVAGSYPDAPVAKLASPFSIGFPSYMNNCSTCHDTQENLDLVLGKPISYQTCISCHDGWNGFGVANTGTAEAPVYSLGGMNHASFGPSTVCTQCHSATAMPTKSKVGDFHNGLTTGRGGLLWAGKDQSVEQAKKVKTEIIAVTEATFPPTTVKVQWVAFDPTVDGSPRYNPCAVAQAGTPADGQPKFLGELQIRRAYMQGNDWVNAGIGTAPGQPDTTTTVNDASTTCDADTKVATTTITYTAREQAALKADTLGVMSLNGRPRVWYTPTSPAAAARSIQVRTPTPLREFVVGTGAEPVADKKRREIVSTEKCASCHLGSMYQHGGERIDNPVMCAMCHNPASNEKNVRVGMGVETSEAYDGNPGQTYDLRYMLHAIHSAGTTNAPYVVYRSNGIYAFGSEATIGNLKATKNWPTDASEKIVCTNGAVWYKVYGSSPTGTKPEVDTRPNTACNTGTTATGDYATGGLGAPAAQNSTDGTWKQHNEIVVHYPRPLNDCGACHVNGSENKLPSTLKAVAVTTYDAGGAGITTASNAGWNNLDDDTLMGPAAASCMSCHQSGDKAIQSMLRAHSAQNGWAPTVFTTGRQYVLEGGVGESCGVCHGAGKTYDYAAKHAGGGH